MAGDRSNGIKVIYEVEGSLADDAQREATLEKILQKIDRGLLYNPFDMIPIDPAQMSSEGRSEYEETKQVVEVTTRQRREFRDKVAARGMADFSVEEKRVIDELLNEPHGCTPDLQENIKAMKNADAIGLAADLTAVNFFEAEARHMQAAILRDENYSICMDSIKSQFDDARKRIAEKHGALDAQEESQFSHALSDTRRVQLELLRDGDKTLLPYLNDVLRSAVTGFREAHFMAAGMQATAKAPENAAKTAPSAKPAQAAAPAA